MQEKLIIFDCRKCDFVIFPQQILQKNKNNNFWLTMKYVIILGDGMADYPIESLGNKTPLMVASKPRMDYMAKHGTIGFTSNVPSDMVPESDTANLAILGYDPKIYSKGRSPLEAYSMGIKIFHRNIILPCFQILHQN